MKKAGKVIERKQRAKRRVNEGRESKERRKKKEEGKVERGWG